MTVHLSHFDASEERERWRLDATYVAAVLVVALAYFGAALAGNALKFTGNVDAIWPPAGVSIGALYLFGLRLWPGVLIGDILADTIPAHSLPLVSNIGQTAGNMLEAIIPAILLARYLGRRSPFNRLEDLSLFAAVIVLGTAISATVGVISLRAGSVISVHSIPTVWRTWWLGDSCGALLLVPLALAWLRPDTDDTPLGSRLEMIACALALVLLSYLALDATHPLIYLVFPAIVWATVRFGPRGGTLAVLVVAGIAIWETADTHGAFALHSITAETVAIQLYIAAAIATTLALTAMLMERRAFARTLSESRTRLIESAEIERSQLERNLHDGAQQRLSALAIRLRAAGSLDTSDQTISFMLHAGEELERAIEELRELARGIHPTLLSRFGLATALDGVCARSSVDVALDLDLPTERLGPSIETTTYYFVAEALTNTQRHARATSATVRIGASADVLTVIVGDNGIGGAVEGEGSGLRGLRDRVEGVGGTFSLLSPDGGGTVLSARLPLST
jgi:signal transduction histidine kinase